MKVFFKLVFRTGLQIILLGLIIWIVFFSLDYFFPKAFHSIDKNGQSLPFKYKVYNLFFKGSPAKESGESLETKQSPTSKESYVWGYAKQKIRNKNKLASEDYYIFLNSKNNQLASNFKFDDELIDSEKVNTLAPQTLITGEISLEYLTSPYFNIDLYDAEGNYLYSLLARGLIYADLNLMQVSAVQNLSFNTSHYAGDGFLVIWSDQNDVDSVLITKVKIEANPIEEGEASPE